MKLVKTLALFIFSFGVPHAHAERIFDLDTGLPPMALRVCWTMSAAKAQSLRSEAEALHGKVAPAVEGCEGLHTTSRPEQLEQGIPRFLTMAAVYDSEGQYQIVTKWKDQAHRIRYNVRQRMARYYFGQVMTDEKGARDGWIELPDEPYALVYFRQRGLWSR